MLRVLTGLLLIIMIEIETKSIFDLEFRWQK